MGVVRSFVIALSIAGNAFAQAIEIGAPPGKLVDVGGRRLHLNCTGSGAPTVVIESGASAFAVDWALVQPEIAKTNRVCSYDRAGHGWSDSITAATPRAGVYGELHRLLQVAQERPPYVLVGASMGGLWVRRYQLEYPDEVVGMVLVDPVHEERLFTMFNGQGIAIAELSAEDFRSTIPQRDFPLPVRQAQTGAPFDKLPPDLYAVRINLDKRLIASQPKLVTYDMNLRGAIEQHADLARLRAAGLANPHPLGDRPVVVLSRGINGNQEMWEVHKHAAQISTNWRHSVVEGSGHEVHLFRPDAVILAIRDVLEANRTHAKLPAR
jgi:pimeloyl-ACP methyl ester carboxylesterase